MDVISVTNGTAQQVSPAVQSEFWGAGISWSFYSDVLSLGGMVVTILGILGNTLCYITAGCLPESTSAHLMKYLAIWDSISASQDGILNLGLRFFGINFFALNVRVFKTFSIPYSSIPRKL